MGFASSSPKVEMQPPAVTYGDVQTNEDVASRDKNKRRLAGAVNTRSSILSQNPGSTGKTLLGQ
jgi:hypothetical protein